MQGFIGLVFLLSLAGLLVSIIKPAGFKYIVKKNFRKKNLVMFFSIVVFVFGVAIGSAAPFEVEINEIVNEVNDFVDEEVVVKDVSIDLINYKVLRVIDGDTLEVSIDGKTEKIRLIGIDTPETVHPYKPVECFGKEASNKAKELLLNQEVRLEVDSTQGDADKYGRLLRYVFRSDGLFFNKWMIENGYAYEYTYSSAYKYQDEFRNALTQAKDNKAGLWADGVCVPPDVMVEDSDGNCNIKGNISKNGKFYHIPSCSSYNNTVINESKGERWFCSVAEAVGAGWARAGNCP